MEEGIEVNKFDVLRNYFGYETFRSGQGFVIDCILKGDDILAVMPTGAGKSLCYQIPAIMLDGVTIVISPLKSLMKDQVMNLQNVGIECAFLNSTLNEQEYATIKSEILAHKYRMIYIAPERLLSRDFLYIVSRLSISAVIVDEAHCVSQWGNDFRKSYLNIKTFIENFSIRPVVAAFTATATKVVEEDIISMLNLRNPIQFKGSFDRPNLYFEKKYLKERDKFDFVLNYLKEHANQCGIIYCSTRDMVDSLYDALVEDGYSVGHYHAGMLDEERAKMQEDFVYDKINIMVATNAFGLGIDKPNVNFVIHYNAPKDIESYYQEAGRAGRDGAKAECILLFNGKDFNTSKFLIEKSYDENEDYEFADEVFENKMNNLEKMKALCYTTDCIRQFILNYFGEQAPLVCDNCSTCLDEYESIDYTIEASAMLKLVRDYDGKYGEVLICDVIRGSKGIKIKSKKMHLSAYYGVLGHLKSKAVKSIFTSLLLDGYIERELSMYPTIHITDLGKDFLTSEEKYFIKRPKQAVRQEIVNNEKEEKRDYRNHDLIFELKALRLDLARKERVPAYIVFSDKTLENMCDILPVNEREFLRVSGVGEHKLKKYGPVFIELIRKYKEKYEK